MVTVETPLGSIPALASDMTPITPDLLRRLAAQLRPPSGKDAAEWELRTLIQSLEGAALMVEQRHRLLQASRNILDALRPIYDAGHFGDVSLDAYRTLERVFEASISGQG